MKRSYFIRTILFYLYPFLFIAQELPPIENISPEVYDAGNQNWMISQDSYRNIYVANNSGLLEFNGANWKLHYSPNGTIIRSVKVIDELVYTGCYMEFGYWKRDRYGNLNYNSLVNKLTIPLIKDEHFWNILEVDDWVLFQSLDRIYLFNPKEETFNVISAKTTRAEIFKVGNSVYFQKINEGVFKIENGKAVLVSKSSILQDKILVGAFLIDEKILFLTENGKFYFLENGSITSWNIAVNDELATKNIYCSLKLKDGSFMIGTTSNGIIHLDRDGNLIRKIKKENGLYNNTVLSIFEDEENNIWLGLDNGISLLNLHSPFISVYNDLKGLLGVVYTAKTHNEYLYLGTNQGLFYKRLGSSNDFKLVENTNGQVWCLNVLKNTLFCGHNNGTYIIKNNKALQISHFAGTWDIQEVATNKNLLLQGNYSGLSVLENINNEWKFRNRLEGFDISSRFFEFITDKKILVNHELNGTFVLNVDDEFRKITALKNERVYGLGSSLIKYKKDIVYSINTNKQVYLFNKEKGDFVWNELLTNTFYKEGNEIIGPLVSEPISNSIWGFSDRNIIGLLTGKLNEKSRKIEIPISSYFRRNLGVTGFENLTYLEDDLFLVGTSDGYIKLDLNNFNPKEYTIKINSIHKEFQNALIENVSLLEKSKFKSDENNLNFSFSVPEFNKYTDVEYQYQLKGFYDDWSLWFKESNVSFENLPSGDYVFSIRARIGNTKSSNIEAYSFSIARPWYFINSMLIVYLFVLLLIFILIHRTYKRHYTKVHERIVKKTQRKLKIEKLESEQQLMKFRNDNLRQDIESKNRELGTSTMNLIKKNEFLNSIKKELNTVKSISELKHVNEIIDKNLNNTDDWKLFEEAFTNADKDFFHKIKLLHPTLNPNDLKLCAYLRLGLSSKEIAPLLNISVKSVEVKRYRLRKKMDLPHDLNISTYIFEV